VGAAVLVIPQALVLLGLLAHNRVVVEVEVVVV